MKLMSINEYRKNRYTPNSRPSRRQIIKLIQLGKIPGIRQGKFFYIDIDAEQELTGNFLVDRVLKESNRLQLN